MIILTATAERMTGFQLLQVDFCGIQENHRCLIIGETVRVNNARFESTLGLGEGVSADRGVEEPPSPVRTSSMEDASLLLILGVVP